MAPFWLGFGWFGLGVEEKEETGERTREAVMKKGGYKDNLAVLSRAMGDVVEEEEDEDSEEEEGEGSSDGGGWW